MSKKILVIDCEYNNINSWIADKIWCIVTKDLQTGAINTFHPSKEGDHFHTDGFGKEFKEFIKDYDHFVGHNFWGAEAPVLFKNLGITFKTSQVTDTLVLSRLFRPISPRNELFGTFKTRGWDNRLGGHSLKSWGSRLKFPKGEFDDFSQYTDEMLKYCIQDVELGTLVYEVLMKEQETYKFSQDCVDLEHEVHKRLMAQTINGFTLSKPRAHVLVEETDKLIESYKADLHKVFPIRKVFKEVYTPRVTKSGVMYESSKRKLLKSIHEDNGDGSYNIYEMQEFNPSSPRQVGERLVDLGWNPRKYTATGLPSTSKDAIGEAIDILSGKAPEVEVLRKYNMVTDRNQKAKKWLLLSEPDGKVHGRVNHIGPWTHRCSHFDDNMANISAVRKDKKTGAILRGLEGNFGWDSRHCWIPRDGWVLVGADASSIQLRALAHYMNSKDYINAVTTGDVHVTNQKAAGIDDRDTSKTFIYAWLLGAGDEKIGQIVGAKESEYEALFERALSTFYYNRFRPHSKRGKKTEYTEKDCLLWFVSDKLRSEDRLADKATVATIIKGHFTKKDFLEAMPSLKKFKTETIPAAAKQGYMEGLDGRKIWVSSAHLAMGAYLQGFESVIMKKAMVLYQDKLMELDIPFRQCAYVHDEFQIETPKEHAHFVGKTVVWAIREAGIQLNSKTPLDGEYKVGASWAETH